MSFINSSLIAQILRERFGKQITVQNVQIERYAEQGFLSTVSHVIVEYVDNDGVKTLSLIAKIPLSESDRPVYHQCGYYAHELLAYREILPKINALLDEPVTAEVYYTDTSTKAVLMEDLGKRGYKAASHSTDQLLAFDDCVAFFETLAKFHAVSHKVLIENPQLLDRIARNPSYEKIRCERLVNIFAPITEAVLKAANYPESWLRELAKIQAYFPFGLSEECKTDNFRFNVFCHGDLSRSNILYKFEPNKKPKIKFIDFQVIKWLSPIYDIIYFTLNSMAFDTFEKHFEQLLDVYVDELNKNLQNVGTGVEYSKRELREDIQRAPLITCYAFSVLGVIMSDHTEIDNAVKTNKTGNEISVVNNMPFRKLYSKWFEYLVKNKWRLCV